MDLRSGKGRSTMRSRKRLLIACNPFKTLLILGLFLVLFHNVHGQSSRILIVQQDKGVRDFSAYIAEILLAEGLVEHELKHLAELSPGDLGKYRVAILPSGSYASDQLDQLESYVKSGGHLVSFLPQPNLSKRLGLVGSVGDSPILGQPPRGGRPQKVGDRRVRVPVKVRTR